MCLYLCYPEGEIITQPSHLSCLCRLHCNLTMGNWEQSRHGIIRSPIQYAACWITPLTGDYIPPMMIISAGTACIIIPRKRVGDKPLACYIYSPRKQSHFCSTWKRCSRVNTHLYMPYNMPSQYSLSRTSFYATIPKTVKDSKACWALPRRQNNNYEERNEEKRKRNREKRYIYHGLLLA